jgi:hypothetical protein
MLPSREASINIQAAEDATRIKIGEFGGLVVTPPRDLEGNIITVRNLPVSLAEETVFAKGAGSSWRDPEMRAWVNGGYAERGDFDWSA